MKQLEVERREREEAIRRLLHDSESKLSEVMSPQIPNFQPAIHTRRNQEDSLEAQAERSKSAAPERPLCDFFSKCARGPYTLNSNPPTANGQPKKPRPYTLNPNPPTANGQPKKPRP